MTAGGGGDGVGNVPPPEDRGNESAVNKLTLTARAFHTSSAWDPRPSEMELIKTRARPYGKGCLCFPNILIINYILISPATFSSGTSTARNQALLNDNATEYQVMQNGESAGRKEKHLLREKRCLTDNENA